MIFLILIITGLGVGFISSFFGVGGGTLVVPMLYTLFPKIPPQVIIASSLGLIFVNSIINTRNFVKAGKVPMFKLSAIISIAMMLGVIIGGKLVLIIDPKIIKIIFASVALLIALKTLFTQLKPNNEANWSREMTPRLLIITAIAGLLGGITAGLTGLGGGVVLIPLFISLLNMPFSWVPVYSNVGMIFGCFAGVITFMLVETPKDVFADKLIQQFQVGYVNWAIVFFIFIGAFFSSKWGVRANQKVDAKLAKKLFAALLIIISLRIFISTFA